MVLLQLVQAYAYLNSVVTWGAIFSVGTIFCILWVMYSALVQPFFSPLRKIPGLPYNPIFGSMMEAVQGETGEVMLKWVKEYGSILRYYFFFGRERIMVADAEALKRIFVTNSKNYIKPPSRMAIVERLIGRGLLLLEGEEHAIQKKIISPAFRPSSLKKMMYIFEEHSLQLVDQWQKSFASDEECNSAVVDVEKDLKLAAFDIIGQCAFGYKFKSLIDYHPGESITACFNRLIGGTGLSWTMAIPYYHHLPTPGNRAFNTDKAVIDTTVENVIKHKRQSAANKEASKDQATCLLDMLMDARDVDTGRGLNAKELHDQVLTFMIAGHETTSVTLSWALLQLARNPKIQEKARCEIRQLLPPRGEPLTWEKVEELKYLDCVIKETLRLHPAGPITMREAVHDDYLGKHFIPAGTFIVCNMGACMRLPENWTDPDVFMPERFEDEKSISASVFLPFITGPRKCMGYRFAIMEMTVILAMLLRDYEFSTLPNIKYKQLMRATVKPFPALKLKISRVGESTTSSN